MPFVLVVVIKKIFCLGNLFNIAGNFVTGEVYQINLSHGSCSFRGNVTYLDFRKLFKCEQIKRIYHGILSIKKESSEN